jgi:hypothetical protein
MQLKIFDNSKFIGLNKILIKSINKKILKFNDKNIYGTTISNDKLIKRITKKQNHVLSCNKYNPVITINLISIKRCLVILCLTNKKNNEEYLLQKQK